MGFVVYFITFLGVFMKKQILIFLLLLNSTAFGIRIKKGKKIETDGIAMKYDFCNKYITREFGTPCCIEITNNKPYVISVDPSIITTPRIHPYHEIVLSQRSAARELAILSSAVTLGELVLFLKVLYQKDSGQQSLSLLPGYSNHSTSCGLYCKLTALTSLIIASALLTTLGIHKGMKPLETIEKALKEEALHEMITIEPGKTAKKLFWLKNRVDILKIDIDLDTIKHF